MTTTTTTDSQSPATLDLESTLQALVEQHGLDAVGNALVQQHGRTAAIAAMLGSPAPSGGHS